LPHSITGVIQEEFFELIEQKEGPSHDMCATVGRLGGRFRSVFGNEVSGVLDYLQQQGIALPVAEIQYRDPGILLETAQNTGLQDRTFPHSTRAIENRQGPSLYVGRDDSNLAVTPKEKCKIFFAVGTKSDIR